MGLGKSQRRRVDAGEPGWDGAGRTGVDAAEKGARGGAEMGRERRCADDASGREAGGTGTRRGQRRGAHSAGALVQPGKRGRKAQGLEGERGLGVKFDLRTKRGTEFEI